MLDFRLQRHAFYALLAAALFGLSTPLSKWLLGATHPAVLAGLLYLGSGLALALVALARGTRSEAPLHGSDWGWLGGAVLLGGVAAPLALMWGLGGTTAGTASLLLNTEGLLTVLLAAALFREAVGRRVAVAMLVMLAAGAVLAWTPEAGFTLSWHALAVVAACLGWAADNNLTRNIAHADPVRIAMIKGLVAGSVNLAIGLATGASLPEPGSLALALGAGALAYGASLVLFIVALRHLGTARTAAHFGTAPFVGAAAAVIFLGEPVTIPLVAGFVMMVIASMLVLSEQHQHQHAHPPLMHTHRHIHDEHHRHRHDEAAAPEPHVHEHSHDALTHSHPHLPDLHHRHRH